MKAIALASFLSLAACHTSPEATNIAANAVMQESALENAADNMEAMADDAADANAAEAMANAAVDLRGMKGDVANAAAAQEANVQ